MRSFQVFWAPHMFYGQHVRDTRAMFFTSWAKYLAQEALTPLEQQLARVILDHPEYHSIFNQKDFNQDVAYFPELGETNPFLHLGLHLAVREQVSTDRPQGIASVYEQLKQRAAHPLDIEHTLMDCLAETLWLAEKNQQPPNEAHYLEACKRLVSNK